MATVKAPAPVAQHTGHRNTGPFVDERQRRQHKNASQQVKAQQVKHAKAHRKQDRANDRITGLHIDRDCEHCRQREDGTGHEGADDGVTCGHEDFGFARVHHLGHKF
jgi:hypothetical protein